MKKGTSKSSKSTLSDKKVGAVSDVPLPKKESRSVPPPDYTLDELLTNIPESDVSDKKGVVASTDVPPPKKERGPVPPPDYTLEELLANIPEPSSKAPKPDSSDEVDTGRPVGKEVW